MPYHYALAQSEDVERITEITVSGNQRIENETILSYMRLDKGDVISDKTMNRALKNLFNTGLFADVNLEKDGTVLKVAVKENPIVNQLFFDGNKRMQDEQLIDEVQLKPRVIYTKSKAQKDVERLVSLYQRGGRFGVTIEPKIIEREQNRVDVIYEIDEGPTTYVRKIIFVGNKAFSDSTLQDNIMTKEDRWYRFLSTTNTYDPDRMAYDKELLRRFYLSKGYIDVEIETAVAELTPDKEAFFITFTLKEGKRYKIGKVSMKTTLEGLDTEALQKDFPIVTGDWYNADKVEDVIQNITDAVGNLGHAFVDVTPNIKPVEGTNIVDIVFDIKEGARVFINQININGNVRTRDDVIRREFRVVEGDAFNSAKLRRSKQRIENLDFFSRVELDTKPVAGSPDKTDVDVTVEEKSTGSLTLGVGWSTYDGALIQTGISERNFLGRGQYLGFNVALAQKRTEYDISFTEPYFLGRDLAAGVDLFNMTHDLQDTSSYDQSSLGGALRLSWSYNEELRQSVKYTLREDEISDVDPDASLYIKEQEGKALLSMVSQSISYDRRNSTIRPSDGYVLTLSNDIAGLGGDDRFLRTDVYAAKYFPLADEWTLAFKGHAGYILGFGQDVRINQRYFLGGNDLRGFEQGGATGRDRASQDALGGDWVLTGTAELIFPLGLPQEMGVRGRLFTDVGATGEPPDTGKYTIDYSSKPRASVGFGISWDSPMGTINIDIAYAVLKEDYDKTEVFRLNFGSGF
ncbi:MAG: outer membrane protein assembly factor BamA [Alphaproteobacteria bacterium]|nr:outer membrane protein assembly factor BamA [Alphaproteobacteria bacterium]